MLKLIPWMGPIAYIVIDIRGPLPMKKHRNRSVTIITDRYSRLTNAIEYFKVFPTHLANLFVNHGLMQYEIQECLLRNDGPQFWVSSYRPSAAFLASSSFKTTASHPKKGVGQKDHVERWLPDKYLLSAITEKIGTSIISHWLTHIINKYIGELMR